MSVNGSLKRLADQILERQILQSVERFAQNGFVGSYGLQICQDILHGLLVGFFVVLDQLVYRICRCFKSLKINRVGYVTYQVVAEEGIQHSGIQAAEYVIVFLCHNVLIIHLHILPFPSHLPLPCMCLLCRTCKLHLGRRW